MEELAIAAKLARELNISDPGYVYFHMVELAEEYQARYPGYRVLCLPGEDEIAVAPDGTTGSPLNIFGDDYPACRPPMPFGSCGA